METIVALDIETTGLDPEREAVIEIGAVRFSGHRVEDEFQTLVQPGRRIPPYITQLTGITDQMVLKAPMLKEVLPALARFVGQAPILGQNIRFDLSFLQRQGLFTNNTILDTYEMAAVVLPSASRYNLSALTQALGVPYAATHRALDDAHATRGVFLRLLEEALDLPLPLLNEIVHLGERVSWSGVWLFRLALRERSRQSFTAERQATARPLPPLEQREAAQIAIPLQPSPQPRPIDVDQAAALIEPGGAFARAFPNFEYRPQQVEMLRAVAQAFNRGRHLLVEAGTGTGKSMAYLIPAALWSLQNNQRVVISTNTINLQDQLIHKDIPDLRRILGIDLRAVVLKGRANYLCPRRWESFRRRGPENADEMRVFGKVLNWLRYTTTGDRAEINLNSPAERQVWLRLSAEDEGCTADTCLKTSGGRCPFFRARQAALGAHLVVVNHALLLTDVALGHRVLPDYDYLIIDEAHHLEEATTNALAFHVTYYDLEKLLSALGGPKHGILGWLLTATQGVLTASTYGQLAAMVEGVTNHAFQVEQTARRFFQEVERFMREQREGEPLGTYAQQERILPATRRQPAWLQVEMAWEEVERCLNPLLEGLKQLGQVTLEVQEALSEADQELASALNGPYRRLVEFTTHMNSLVFEPREDQIYWAEVQGDGTLPSLHVAPLHIGSLMERYIWQEKAAVILTSATLTAAGEFDYLRNRLNAAEADELALGSPFDYETSALLYVVNDIPEPTDRNGHQRAVENALVRLCRATGGRALVLFTSYEQLRRTSTAIAPLLAREDILVYEQGEGASPHALLETFRSAERAVLLGTRAFWEGVDVPGEALSVLVIARLPFDVPSDPVVAARAETFDDPFYEYSLPEAILRFRQGFGRLIRTQSDRGVVVVLDRRVLTKKYGRLFLESLPPCTVKVGPLSEVVETTRRWLNL